MRPRLEIRSFNHFEAIGIERPVFRNFSMSHIGTVPESMRSKFGVRSFRRYGVIGILRTNFYGVT